MSLSNTPLGAPVGNQLIVDTQLGSTPDTNLRNGPTTVWACDCDNTQNSAATYLKMWDATTATVGTTDPDFILKIPANTRKVIWLDLSGTPFLVGLTMAAVTTGGTPGTTSPVSPFAVRVLCS